MRAHGWLRAGLLLLTVLQFVAGVWLLLFPRSFYDDIPWVAMYPPYNEHFVRDLGGLYLALGVVLAASVILMERRLIYTALAAYLVYSGSHTVFHATHLDHFTLAGAVAQTTTLALTVVIPLLLLPLVRRERPLPERSGRGSAS